MRRKTVALCLDYIHPFSQGYQANVRQALDEQCERRDINLMVVVGRAIDEPNPDSVSYNAIYDFIVPDCVDGVIILSATLACHCGVAGVQRFVQRLGQLPCCSLGLVVPSVPSVTLDNRRGMASAVEHMVDHHGYRRIAFLAGPAASEEAQSRLDAYRETLQRYGIEFDPELVRHGDFQLTRGRTAMTELIAQGIEMDAVVAASDLMALGAISALRTRGTSSSIDLPITGFDDLPACRNENPPLTSVAQPFASMAEHALELVLTQVAGCRVSETTLLPPRLVVRRSCGCQPDARRPSAPRSVAQVEVQQADQTGASVYIPEAPTTHADAQAAMSLIDLREYLLSDRASTIDPAARAQMLKLVGSGDDGNDPTDTAGALNQQATADETLQSIVSVSERISSALDVPTLCNALLHVLPAVGIATAYVSRFVDIHHSELESLVSLYRREPVSLENRRFPAHRMFPRESLDQDERLNIAAFPIVFDAQLRGIAVFEYADDRQGYQLIRDQIAIALRSVALHQAVVEQTKLHERHLQEQERLATAERLKALSVLAGGVAHDLNNALGPMVALPDIMLHALDALEQRHGADPELREDLRSMKGASLRAAETIKDLLTLSRQGRTSKETLDLAKLVSTCTTGDALTTISNINERIQIHFEAPTTPVVVRGSEAHLLRAVSNLVRNASEAIQGAGRVTLKVQTATIDAPISGFETVTPGDYAIVTVSDNGAGIASADLRRIFEPFTSQKRLGAQSGSGLGLAIVHGVVKEHDGFIDVSSTVGHGTTFTLYFPASKETLTFESRPSEMKRGNARILVVDDDPTQLRTCRRVLGHLGYDVTTQSSGREALELFARAANLRESPFDLVILDMMLDEGMDGLDIHNQILRHFPGLKAIVASGYAAVERAEAAVQSGLVWLVKPYTAEGLAQAVHSVLTERTIRRSTTLSTYPPKGETYDGHEGRSIREQK